MVSLLPRAPYLASLGKPTARASSSSLRLPAMSSPAPAPAPAATAAAEPEASRPRKMPVLLFDVMDTVVRDPFYHHIPSFFQFRTCPYSLFICLVYRYPFMYSCGLGMPRRLDVRRNAWLVLVGDVGKEAGQLGTRGCF